MEAAGSGNGRRERRAGRTALAVGAAMIAAQVPVAVLAVPLGAPGTAAAGAGARDPQAAGRLSLNALQESGQRFHPVWSGGGMVASQEGRASEAGVALLRQGGNAVDAAVATAFALAVTLPQAGNLGGGGFALVWLPGASPAAARGCLARRAGGGTGGSAGPELPLGRGMAVAVNFREAAPAAAGADLFLRPDGEVDRQRATRSLRATAVPGSVAGLVLLQRCYGRLPLRRVMAAAMAMAERGVVVDRELADSLEAAQPLLEADPTSRQLFLRPAGRRSTGLRSAGLRATGSQPAGSLAPGLGVSALGVSTLGVSAPPVADSRIAAYRPLQPGEVLRQPALAATLRRIARQGEAGFYRGPVAEALVRLMREREGLIDAGDLGAYRARLVRPLLVRFRGHPVLGMPPPGGGLTLAQLVRLLEPFNLEGDGAGAATSVHRLVEAMNLAFRDRNRWLGDPDQTAIPLDRLLSEEHLGPLRARIDPRRHTPAAELLAGDVPASPREGVNTTHLSVADREGGLVALTTTLNFAYGNGVSVPGAGFLLNNEMDDFTAAPGRANAFGLVQGPANAIAPGRRPLSSMAPTLVFRPDGSPWLATGSPGGSRIISTVLQVLLQRIVWGANLATAVAAPRLHSQLLPDQVQREEGFSPDTLRLLEGMGHRLRPAPAMGAANSVEVLLPVGSGSLGVMDPRRGIGTARGEAAGPGNAQP